MVLDLGSQKGSPDPYPKPLNPGGHDGYMFCLTSRWTSPRFGSLSTCLGFRVSGSGSVRFGERVGVKRSLEAEDLVPGALNLAQPFRV